MQTKILNIYKPNTTLHLAFEQGVQAAQQEPINKQVKFEETHTEDLEATVLGYYVNISLQEDADSLKFSCHYELKIYNSADNTELEEVSTDQEELKDKALEYLSDLITKELGHPVKFVL
jgi:hypothetical protein